MSDEMPIADMRADAFFIRLDMLLSVTGYGADFQGSLADAVKRAYEETVPRGDVSAFEREVFKRLELRGTYEEVTYYEGVKRALEALFAGCFDVLSMDIHSVHALASSMERVRDWMRENVGTDDVLEGLSLVEERLGVLAKGSV